MTIIAALQMNSTHDVDENLAQVTNLVHEAVSQEARLVVLPEMFPIMGVTDKEKVSVQECYGDGKIQRHLAQLAKDEKCWIVAGTIPIQSDDKNKIRASCLVYDAEGIIKARYDKIHLFDVEVSTTEVYQESATTQPGETAVVIDTPFGKLGLAVCYDLRFPALFNQLAHRGAEIIAVPSAFTAKTGEAHWSILTRARALDTLSYLIGSCQYGIHANGRQTYGHSVIVSPWGSVLSELNEPKTGIIYATIDLNYLRKIRNSIPILKHNRIGNLT